MILENAVEMQGIVKVYPNGVVANEGVDFCIAKGEIHALSRIVAMSFCEPRS